MDDYKRIAEIVKKSKHTTIFTGAGISVESGIPPFRGENGLWSKYDMKMLDINYFLKYPKESWDFSIEVFYKTFKNKVPNIAHEIISELENKGYITTVITQNIDNLHKEAGSKNVLQFHGNFKKVICMKCNEKYNLTENMLSDIPPYCEKCGGVLKPDFIFFGEALNENIYEKSFNEAVSAEVFIIIGTTGKIQPASMIPIIAKQNGVFIIEINVESSEYTEEISDIFIKEKATVAMKKISDELNIINNI
jgi:NAD-dependent deacetylase